MAKENHRVNTPICSILRFLHGGEARDLKLEIPGTPRTVRICISLIFSLKMVGFAWGLLQTI